MEENPFPDLLIDSTDILESVSGRQKCPKCQRSRKYYCYNCYVPVVDNVPKIKLPLKIDVIKHPSEVDGKSTAVHAAVIAPDDVTVYTYPCIPDYNDKDKVVLVFPGDTSVTLSELAKKLGVNSKGGQTSTKRKFDDIESVNTTNENKNKATKLCSEQSAVSDPSRKGNNSEKEQSDSTSEINTESLSQSESFSKENHQQNVDVSNEHKDLEQSSELTNISKVNEKEPESTVGECIIEKVIFIDSTWNQTRSIYRDERLKGIQRIELKTRDTKFWRHQKDIPSTYLSTIEAMYYFLREYHEQFISSGYHGDYDNLLFFFKFMHGKIRTLYDGGNELKAYKERENKQAVK